jgi:two-component system response regulator HydG
VIRDTDIEFLHPVAAPTADTPPRVPTLAEAERAHIIRVLDAAAWNKKEAARLLAISRGTLYRKIVEYGLEPNTRLSRNRTAQ